MSIRWRAATAAMIGACAAATVSCGEPEDVVYIHVFNAYAAGGDLSIFSNAGVIATGVKFGDHAPGGRGPDPVGVEVDRSVWDGSIQVQVDGVPVLATNLIEAFDFFPGESVTLMVSRRTSASEFEVRVVRHTLYSPIEDDRFDGNGNIPLDPRDQIAPQPSCALKLYNGLSVGNAYTDGRYDIMSEWRLSREQIAQSGIYSAEVINNPAGDELDLVTTQCGNPIARGGGLDDLFRRRANRIRGAVERGWFFPTRPEGEEGAAGATSFRAGTWEEDGFGVRGLRSTEEFIECISASIQVVLNDSSGGDPCANYADNERISQGDLSFDAARINACVQRAGDPIYEGIGLGVGALESPTLYFSSRAFGNDPLKCQATIRVRTRFIESVFENDPAIPNSRENAQLPVFSFDYSNYSLQHLFVFGRPIDPLYYTFNSLAKSVAAAIPLEYPNGVDPDTYNGMATGGQ